MEQFDHVVVAVDVLGERALREVRAPPPEDLAVRVDQ